MRCRWSPAIRAGPSGHRPSHRTNHRIPARFRRRENPGTAHGRVPDITHAAFLEDPCRPHDVSFGIFGRGPSTPGAGIAASSPHDVLRSAFASCHRVFSGWARWLHGVPCNRSRQGVPHADRTTPSGRRGSPDRLATTRGPTHVDRNRFRIGNRCASVAHAAPRSRRSKRFPRARVGDSPPCRARGGRSSR